MPLDVLHLSKVKIFRYCMIKKWKYLISMSEVKVVINFCDAILYLKKKMYLKWEFKNKITHFCYLKFMLPLIFISSYSYDKAILFSIADFKNKDALNCIIDCFQ